MYPITRNFSTVMKRLKKLANTESEHKFSRYESFAASYCVAEKIVRRVFVRLVKKATPPGATPVQLRGGFNMYRNEWPNFDDQGRKLVVVIGDPAMQLLTQATTDRNMLLHGYGDPGHEYCLKSSHELIALMPIIREKFKTTYGFSGWR